MSRAKVLVAVALMTTIVVALPVLAVRTKPSGPRRIHVEVVGFTDGQHWHFTPNVIRATAGDTLDVRFVAVGAGHGFRVQGTTVDLTAYPGQPQEVVFVPDWVGGREWYCTFDCGMGHAQMSGMIVVAPRRP